MLFTTFIQLRKTNQKNDDKNKVGDHFNRVLTPAKSHGGNNHQEDEEDNRDERRHHRAARFLAKVPELLADGHPVGVGIAVVSQVYYGRRRPSC